jgi:hypothetical protein
VARNSLEEIAVDLGELERMIDDILTTTRMELQSGAHKATAFPLRLGDVAPSSIALCASERFRARYPERRLELSVAEALPDIHVDATLFRRVIDHLLDNASKYSPDAGTHSAGRVEGWQRRQRGVRSQRSGHGHLGARSGARLRTVLSRRAQSLARLEGGERGHVRASAAAAGAPHVHPHADLVASGLLELAVAAVLGLDVASRWPHWLRWRRRIFAVFLAATGRG